MRTTPGKSLFHEQRENQKNQKLMLLREETVGRHKKLCPICVAAAEKLLHSIVPRFQQLRGTCMSLEFQTLLQPI